MVLHESFLRYRRFRWLVLSLLGLGAAVLAYGLDHPAGGRSGGSPTGLALGSVSAALIVWLLWFGIRKRSYAATGPPLVGWLSAHVYLGTALLLLVPLHAAFRFGWNVHTLAYALMSAVVITGLFGVVLYSRVPRLMTANRSGEKLAALFDRVDGIDAECRVLAGGLAGMAPAVERSVTATTVGGSLWRQLSASDRGCPTAAALAELRTLRTHADGGQLVPAERETVRKLLGLLALKRSLLGQIRRDIRWKAWLDVWLLAHVPLAVTTLAAVVTHVFVVFYYR
jgi:hypothetical protein